MGEAFEQSLRVRYAECDVQGVVFNAQYLAYFDVSMTELWRAAFGSYQAMLDRGVDLVVAEAGVRFLAPARFDDRLTLLTTIDHIGTTSLTTHHRVHRDGATLAQGTLRHVTVERQTWTKTRVPDWMREGLAPWRVEQAPGPTGG